MGRLTQITFPINGSRTPIVTNIQYNNANLILSYDLPLQSITRTQTFDPKNDFITQIEVKGPTYMTYASWDDADRANQLNRLDLPQYRQTGIITGNALPYFTQSYRYDLAGNRTQMIHKEPKDTTTFTYEYDKQNQLTAFGTAVNDADPIVQHYSYDVQGNRTQLTQPNTQVNITIDPKANHPNDFWFGLAKSEQSWAELTYDKNGNRLSKTLKSNANPNMAQSLYTYDDRNRMTTYTLNGTQLLTHKYQFSGPRYEKKETQPNGTTVTRFYNDDSLRLLSEKVTDTTGQKAYSYIYLGNQKLARISQNESSKKDEVSYFLTDALGSATFITYHHTASPNDALRITESLLDPWGNSVKNGFFNQTKVQDFTGKAVDEASSLYDFGFRFYDPFLATWIGKDLVPADHSAPLTLNEYLYALGNPLRWVDPDGRLSIFVHGTWSSVDQADPSFIKGLSQTFGENIYLLSWSGGNTKEARHEGAEALGKYINAHKFAEGEKLNIVAHSHGGNVVKDMTQSLNLVKKIDTLAYLGTPHRSDYQLDFKDISKGAKILNMYDLKDQVQLHGGPWGGSADRLINYGKNLQINSSLGPIDSHTTLDSLQTWNLGLSFFK